MRPVEDQIKSIEKKNKTTDENMKRLHELLIISMDPDNESVVDGITK